MIMNLPFPSFTGQRLTAPRLELYRWPLFRLNTDWAVLGGYSRRGGREPAEEDISLESAHGACTVSDKEWRVKGPPSTLLSFDRQHTTCRISRRKTC